MYWNTYEIGYKNVMLPLLDMLLLMSSCGLNGLQTCNWDHEWCKKTRNFYWRYHKHVLHPYFDHYKELIRKDVHFKNLWWIAECWCFFLFLIGKDSKDLAWLSDRWFFPWGHARDNLDFSRNASRLKAKWMIWKARKNWINVCWCKKIVVRK